MAHMKHFIHKSAQVLLVIMLVSCSSALYGLSLDGDSAKVEVLMNHKMLSKSKFQQDAGFITSIDITSKQLVLLSTNKQFYLLGWGLINPVCKPVAENITSFAYTSDNLLMVIRNDEICSIDSTENLKKFMKLPRKGMGISAGKYVMYIYDRYIEQQKYSLFILAQGGKYQKVLELPAAIQSVVEMNNSILIAMQNGLFLFDVKQKKLKALFALPKGKEIKSIATDTINNRIYFSTDSAVYAYKDSNAILVTDKLGGTLRFFNGGLIVFNPEKQLLIRIVGLENGITTNKMPTEVAATTTPTTVILTNESIINLVKAELSDEMIIKIINKSEVNFNVGIDSMIELSNQNVSSAVISAMKSTMKKKADVNDKSSN
jgi:hypothetical protein